MKQLGIILLLGLFIRLISFSWIIHTPQNGDLLRYVDWGRIAFLKGFNQTYNKETITFGGDPNNQPPGSLYPISLAYYSHLKAANIIHKIYKESPWQENQTNQAILYFFMRIPSFIAEILLTIIIFIFVRKQKGKYPHLSAALLYLNPVLIYNSAFWGQMDAINNLFFITALVLITSGKIVNSVIFFVLSCMIKLSILPLLPLYMIQLFKQHLSNKQLIASIAASAGIILLLTLPVSKQPIIWLTNFIQLASGGELQNITSEAYNLWYVLFSFPLSAKIIPVETSNFLGIHLSLYGYLLYILFAAPLFLQMFRGKNITSEKTFILFAALALIAFLFLPKMHERYLYPFFPLLAVALGFSKRWLWLFISVSFIHFLNLFISWDPGYVIYIPYSILENDWFKWGLGVVLIGVFAVFYKQFLITEKDGSLKS